MPYFFVYCDANKKEGSFSIRRKDYSQLTWLSGGRELQSKRSRGAANLPHSTGALLYDHMFDHNRLWRTWKQRRKERRRASFPERKGPNGFHAHVTPSSSNRLGAGCWEFKSPHSDQKDFRSRLLLKSFFRILHRTIWLSYLLFASWTVRSIKEMICSRLPLSSTC